jgi:hypothetical protein
MGVLFVLEKAFRSVLLIVFLSGFIFVAGGEIYFRMSCFGPDGVLMFGRYVPAGIGDPLTSLEYDDATFTGLKAGSSGIFKGARMTVNSLGFRDKERAFARNGATKRIVICGTSISMGSGVGDSETYAAQMEAALQQADPSCRHEVINLAIGGYGMADMVETLSSCGMKFDPDIILIESYGWGNDERHKMKGVRQTRLKTLRTIIRKPSRFFFFVQAIRDEFFVNARAWWRSRKRAVTLNRPVEAAGVTAEDGVCSAEDVSAYMDKIKKISRGKNVYIVALRPMRYLDRAMNPEGLVKDLCEKHGLGFIDTYQEDYGQNANDMIIYVGDRHPNSKAHGIYARAIMRSIGFCGQ